MVSNLLLLNLKELVNFITKKKYTFKIGYTGNFTDSKSRPEDLTVINGDCFFLCYLDYFNSYQISFGKIYEFNKKGTIRENLSFGLGLTTIREHQN